MEFKDLNHLRGDYEHIRPDFTTEQKWEAYSEAEHARWRALYARQMAQLPAHACEEAVAAVAHLDYSRAIPRFDEISKKLHAASGWTLVAVPGLLPEDVFFGHLAKRHFPVTVWLRGANEMDYIVEPDVFHDFFGHVPLLFQPHFADFLHWFGEAGVEAAKHGLMTPHARLYWYTVEFGLVKTAAGARAYGAGLLSSPGELHHSVFSGAPLRVPFNAREAIATAYRVDVYQPRYFVLEDFAQLLHLRDLDWNAVLRAA